MKKKVGNSMGQEEKYMDEYIKEISEKIEDKKEYYAKISDKIWEYAEPRFQEYKSSELLQQTLKKEGFSIKSNLAGEETAFIAEYGSGKPVIGFLGEFDALPGLSQKADTTERIPEEKTSDSKYESVPEREKKQNPDSGHTDNCGHGCGHQLIGTGTLASVIALKDFMKEHNLKGTIRYYGCPAEENAGGKAFLVRDGYFDDCDLALCWHPEQGRRACYGSTKANFRVFFTFHGTPAHASMCPELGRSALDAVELMDVGVNYMREHMIDEARIHYAITDTGGDAPNVVQSRAQVLYAIRAPKITQVKELYNRVCNIAKGAALMTETTVEIRQVAAYSNLISSKILADHMNTYLEKLGPIPYTEQEYAYAQKFQQSLGSGQKPTSYNCPGLLWSQSTGSNENPNLRTNRLSKSVQRPQILHRCRRRKLDRSNRPPQHPHIRRRNRSPLLAGSSPGQILNSSQRNALRRQNHGSHCPGFFTKSRTGKSSQKRTDRNSKRRNISQSITERPETRDMVKVTFCQFPARSHLSPGVNLTSLSNS